MSWEQTDGFMYHWEQLRADATSDAPLRDFTRKLREQLRREASENRGPSVDTTSSSPKEDPELREAINKRHAADAAADAAKNADEGTVTLDTYMGINDWVEKHKYPNYDEGDIRKLLGDIRTVFDYGDVVNSDIAAN